MKITSKTDIPAILSSKALNHSPDSDLLPKPKPHRPPRRKASCSAAGVRLRRDGALSGRRSRPETPLLQWKFDDGVKEQRPPPETSRESRRKRKVAVVSGRKLAAVLWRLLPPEVPPSTGHGEKSDFPKKDRLGFQVILILRFVLLDCLEFLKLSEKSNV